MNTLGGGVAWRLLEHICIQTCPSTEPAGDGAEELAHGHIWQAARTHVIAPLCLLSLATTGRRLPEAYSLPNGSCAAYIPCSTTNCLDGADMLLHNWQISLTKPPAAAVQLLMQLLRSCLRHEESGMHRCSVLISSLVYLLDIDAQYDWATVDSIADVMLSLLGASSASFEAAAANQVDLAELHGLVFATGLRFAPQTTVAYIGRLVRHEVAPQCTFDSSNACQSLITGLAKVEGGVDHRKLWLEILTPWITLHDEPRLQHEAHRIMAALSKGRRYNDISRILIKGAHERLVEGLRHQPQNTVADIGAAHLVLNWMAALWRHCTAGGEPAWRDLVKLDWPATTAAFAKFADGLRSSPDAAEKVSALQAGFDKLDRRLHIQSGRDAEAAAAALLADEAAEAAGKALQEVKTAAKAAAKRAKKQRAKQKGKALTPLAVAALDAAVEQATEMGGSSDAAAELVSEVAGSSDAAAELASKAASSNDAIVEPVTEEADARDAAGTTELQPRACAVSEAVHAAHASSSPPTAFISSPGMYGITEDAVSCPITQEVMQDPVVCADGHTYERIAIAAWLKVHDTSPMTNEPLEHKRLIPNVAVRQVVGLFLQQTRSD
ncbi:hypothetical protein WJX72_006523 [[Myrmecia] bisecta]|uniref:U-box domain-containing protein n=1 Tax=[Myrmecia] bisecta TaxID=41462 RepID=A0AAW1R863_9CHLO